MISEISVSDAADLRATFVDAGYNENELQAKFGTAAPPAPHEVQARLYATREVSAQNALVRLFLLGVTLDRNAATEALPRAFVDLAQRVGLIFEEENRLIANVVIVPVGKVLFASDAFRVLGSDERSEFIVPAKNSAADFLRRLTVRERVGTVLDLGCGCGVHALLAAEHCDNVVATDISADAVAYTRFNAQLNDIRNVDALVGDLFEPVAGRGFDLILCNPPFIIGPTSDFTYRDNPMELDDFCKLIAREGATHLNEGGHMQMLSEWVETADQLARERVGEWVQGLGCDTWVLRGVPKSPARYVAGRLTDLAGADYKPATSYEDWLAYFEDRGVTAINPGMLVLRRRKADNWFHMLTVPGEPIDESGSAVSERIAACDFLELCEDDESLLDATLRIPTNIELEQRFTRSDEGWQSQRVALQITSGLSLETEIDLPILAFLNHVDGNRSVRDCINTFCELATAEPAELTRQLLPAIRLFIGNGVLEAADLAT
jgi:methylase of polypeptide subunit release factors